MIPLIFISQVSIHLIAKAKNFWNSAEAILIGAGAGMGVDSGLPDFRGKHGFWKAYTIGKTWYRI